MSGTISTLLHAASGAAAYQRTAGAGEEAPAGGGADFSKYVSNLLTDTVKQGSSTETLAQNGLMGNGDLTQVVTSVAQAQLALQTTVAIRDRLITAYQSIMSMPI